MFSELTTNVSKNAKLKSRLVIKNREPLSNEPKIKINETGARVAVWHKTNILGPF